MPACARCGFELGVHADSCPLCGALLTETGAVAGRTDHATPVGPPVPWEDPGSAFPANFVRSFGEIIRGPTRFFARVRFDEPLARPILFYLIVVIVAAFFQLLVTAAVGVPESVQEAFGTYDVGVEMSPGALTLTTFFATPFVLLLGLLVYSLVIHLFVAILVRDRRPLGATARTLCYAVAPYPLSAIPIIGPLASTLWITVLTILGLRYAHRTTTGRAVAAVLMPLAILTAFVILFYVLAFWLMLNVAEPV